MKLSKYGRVGKAPLIRAIGIQKNYKEIIYTETKELDRAASGCFSCPNYKNISFLEYLPEETKRQSLCCCQNCPHAIYKTVVHETYKYINEKNMFGNTPRLKAIALKLLLVYHFLGPDDKGIIKHISVKELAALINCTSRSIRNANDTLQKYGYIVYCNDAGHKNMIQVMLPEYNTYGLTADQGGRGYATFNVEYVKEILKIDDLNQLRMFLRMALEIDTNRNQDKEPVVSKEVSFFRRFLPRYCKPGVIRHALDHASKIFTINYNEDTISMKMDPRYHGRRNFEKNNKANSDKIRSYINDLNAAMDNINQSIINGTPENDNDLLFLANEGITQRCVTFNKHEIFPSFRLNPEDFKDLGLLCTTFSFDEVKKCVSYVYNNYNVRFKTYSIGALIRKILKENSVESNMFALAV